MSKVMGRWFLIVIAAVGGLQSAAVFGQEKPPIVPNQMETVFYGAAYYPEYMPYERLDVMCS